MRVLIGGATGAIGRPLIGFLRARGHVVFALARSPGSARVVAALGAEAVIADVLDTTAMKTAIMQVRPEAVINELTSLPRHYTVAEMAAAAERDRQVRIEGNKNFLAVLPETGVRRYLLQSSGFWYAPGVGLAERTSHSLSRHRRRSQLARAAMQSWNRRHRQRQASSSLRCDTGSFTAPVPGSTAPVIWVSRSGGRRCR